MTWRRLLVTCGYGETTITVLAAALTCARIKTGAPTRAERAAKYKCLLQIEAEPGESAFYPGTGAFNNIKR